MNLFDIIFIKKVRSNPPCYMVHHKQNVFFQVWSQVKGHVAGNNTTFKLDDVKELFKQGLTNVSAEHWKNYDNHVHKIEETMWENEETIDQLHENFSPIIIRPFEEQDEDSDLDDFNDDHDSDVDHDGEE